MDEVDALGETEEEQARRQQRPRLVSKEVNPEEERARGGDELPVVELRRRVHGVGERRAQPADAALHSKHFASFTHPFVGDLRGARSRCLRLLTSWPLCDESFTCSHGHGLLYNRHNVGASARGVPAAPAACGLAQMRR